MTKRIDPHLCDDTDLLNPPWIEDFKPIADWSDLSDVVLDRIVDQILKGKSQEEQSKKKETS